MVEGVYEVKINTTRSDLADGAVIQYKPLRGRAFVPGLKITDAIESSRTVIGDVDHPDDCQDLAGYLQYWIAHDMTDLSHENPYELVNSFGQADRSNRPYLEWEWMREFYERVAVDGLDCQWGVQEQIGTSIVIVRFDPEVVSPIRLSASTEFRWEGQEDPPQSFLDACAEEEARVRDYRAVNNGANPHDCESMGKHLFNYDYAAHASDDSLLTMRDGTACKIRPCRDPNWNADEKAWPDSFSGGLNG